MRNRSDALIFSDLNSTTLPSIPPPPAPHTPPPSPKEVMIATFDEFEQKLKDKGVVLPGSAQILGLVLSVGEILSFEKDRENPNRIEMQLAKAYSFEAFGKYPNTVHIPTQLILEISVENVCIDFPENRMGNPTGPYGSRYINAARGHIESIAVEGETYKKRINIFGWRRTETDCVYKKLEEWVARVERYQKMNLADEPEEAEDRPSNRPG